MVEPHLPGSQPSRTPQRTVAALLDRRRILRCELLGLERAIAVAQTELERCLREEWLACVHGEFVDRELRWRSERTCHDVDRLARELVLVRGALNDIELGLGDFVELPDSARASA